MKNLVILLSFIFSIYTFNLPAQLSVDLFAGTLFNKSIEPGKNGGVGPLFGFAPSYDFNKKWTIKTSVYFLSEVNSNRDKSNLISFSPFAQLKFDENISCQLGYFFRYVFQNSNHNLSALGYKPRNTDHGLSLQFRYKHLDYFSFIGYNFGLGKSRDYNFGVTDGIYYTKSGSRGVELGVGYTFSKL